MELEIILTELQPFELSHFRQQTPYPLGFNDNIYHEGNLSKMPDFDVFSSLEFRERTARSHGIKKNGNCKRKSRVQKLANCTLRDLATKLDVHGRIVGFHI